MGCNTSKESAPQTESENKENKDNVETAENKSDAAENHVTDSSEAKSPSAKTITLRSNGTSKTDEERSSKDRTPEEPKEDEEEAAKKIQAAFRGHKTRKSMKQPAGKVEPSTAPSDEPTREQLEEEFRLDDRELCNAATKIQASFRGHMTRKAEAEKKTDDNTDKPQEGNAQDEEELDIDLSDPDLNKAAVKIQASFRGHMVRKDNEGESTNN